MISGQIHPDFGLWRRPKGNALRQLITPPRPHVTNLESEVGRVSGGLLSFIIDVKSSILNNTLMPVYHSHNPVFLGKWPLLQVR